MLRYGIYARKSDDDTSVTEKSIDDQVAELETIKERDSLLVVRKWRESKSAKIPGKRQAFTEMIRLIEKGTIDAILVWHVNRLVRNMEEGGKLVQLFVEGKIKEIRTPSGTYKTGDNILPLVVEAASAAQFSLDHTNAVNRGRRSKTRQGGWNHKAPQGYLNKRHQYISRIGIIEKDPERFDLIRKVWEMALTGAYTYKQIQTTLNDTWGYRTRRTQKRAPSRLSEDAIRELLANPFYAGNIREEGEIIAGEHKDIAMITIDEFQRVQEIFGKRFHQSVHEYEYPYTGLMHCAYCAQSVTAETRRIKSSGRLWTGYHCSNSGNKCTAKGMDHEFVERKVVEALESVSIDPDLCEIAIDNIIRSLDNQTKPAQALYELQHKTLAGCEEELKKLTQMWLKGLIRDESRYKQLEGEILSTKNDLTCEVEKSQSELATMRANALAAGNFIMFARDKFMTANVSKKREIAHALGFTYKFYGIEKDIALEVHPILVEVVKFAKQSETTLELKSRYLATGSNKQKTSLLQPVSSSGGSKPARTADLHNVNVAL
jgi:site-specific DNA recombinase